MTLEVIEGLRNKNWKKKKKKKKKEKDYKKQFKQ